jgi:flavodoxin
LKALIVFESMFGNTQKIAEAVGKGLSSLMQVEVVEVGAAPDKLSKEVVLLVVGGPTHAFSISRESTRREAEAQASAALVSKGRGLREWLAGIDKAPKGVSAAAFDTRIDKGHWLEVAGTAGRAIDKRLRKNGFRAAGSAQSFIVEDVSGPLRTGELERARSWGEELGRAFSTSPQKRRSR